MVGKEVRRSRPGGRSGSGLWGSKTGQSSSQKARQGGGRPVGGGERCPGPVGIDPGTAGKLTSG